MRKVDPEKRSTEESVCDCCDKMFVYIHKERRRRCMRRKFLGRLSPKALRLGLTSSCFQSKINREFIRLKDTEWMYEINQFHCRVLILTAVKGILDEMDEVGMIASKFWKKHPAMYKPLYNEVRKGYFAHWWVSQGLANESLDLPENLVIEDKDLMKLHFVPRRMSSTIDTHLHGGFLTSFASDEWYYSDDPKNNAISISLIAIFSGYMIREYLCTLHDIKDS